MTRQAPEGRAQRASGGPKGRAAGERRSTRIDRRTLLKATASLPLLAVPGCRTPIAETRPVSPLGASSLFRHGVASGDPLADRVILWTRVTSGDGPVDLVWRVARDPEMRDEVVRGRARTDAGRDHTVKIDARGLEPGSTYYYRFETGGEASPLGRTRTLRSTDRVRLGFCSCSNLPFGHFNAYGLLARRDLDAVLHLGDYLYEYRNGSYGNGTALGRVPEPDREIVSLADYRTRHAQYKRDPDLQELHRQHPMIAVWDDHELANNAWMHGAQNHQPEKGEGDWTTRRAAAVRSYLEWMPVRETAGAPDRTYRRFRFGDLVDLFMLDTRLIGRDRQLEGPASVEALSDPARSLLGAEQERWLLEGLSDSKQAGTAWQVVGQQVMMAPLRTPEGLVRNTDSWDGYPESRRRLLDHVEHQDIRNLVVLTGDVHSSWAFDLPRDPFDPDAYDPATGRGSLGVEFATPGVTSPHLRNPDEAARRAADTQARHPHLHWVDLYHRGYAVLDLDRARAQCEWYFVETLTERRLAEAFGGSFRVQRGSSHLSRARRPSPPRPSSAEFPPTPEVAEEQ